MKNPKSFGVLFFTLFTLFNLQAQDSDSESDPTAKNVKIKLVFGSEYENERKNTIVTYMLKDGKGDIYTIKLGIGGMFSSTKNYIEKYSPNLKQVFEKELIVDNTDGKDLGIVNAFTLKGQPYIFGDFYNKDKDRRYLFAMKIDEKGNLGKPVKIAEFDSERNSGSFYMKISKDSTKVLIASMPPPDKKKDALPVVFSVLDNELKEIWKGETAFPTDKKWGLFSGTTYTTLLDNFMVDNTGKVIALIEIPREKESKEKEDSYRFYKLFIFQNGTKESKKLTIDLNKKTIYSFQILETTNPNEMIGVGTYSDNKKIGWFSENVGTNGTFFFRINTQTGEVINKSINPFNRKVFEFMRIDAEEQKKGEGINNVKLWDYHITDKNNVLLSLEQKYIIVTTHRMPNGATYTTTTYHSGTMFNVKYDKEGKIIYQNFVPKRLAASTPFGMYHILAPRDETHAMVFNDHRKNVEKKLEDYRDQSTAKPGSDRTVARMVTVDETGKRKVSTLFANKDEDFVLQPNVAFQYAPGVIISMGIDGKKFKLLKIEY